MRIVGIALVTGWFVFALGFLLLRWVVMPQVGDYREQIAAELTRASGLPVEIGGLAADWAGLRPRVHLTGLVVGDEGGRPALEVQQVDAVLAWSSLLRWTPYFDRLEIIGAALAVRREVDGSIVVAGLRRRDERAGELGIVDWLMAQRKLVVRDAALTWTDLSRDAPPLELADVEFVLERGVRRQRFALRAQPPAALASMLDIRGDLRHVEGSDLASTIGRLFVGLERADLGGWQQWLDYPIPLAGQGGLRLWLDLDGPGLIDVEAEVALDAAIARFADDLPELNLKRLDGRFLGRKTGDGFEVEARRLALSTGDDVAVGPMDFRLRVNKERQGKEAGGDLTANVLDFAALARLAAHLPLDESVRLRLAAFDPRGQVRNLALAWHGDVAAPRAWTLDARFDGIGLAARENLPGVGGLSGEIQGSEQGGRFLLGGQDTHIDLPDIFENSRLAFASFKADGGWTNRDGRLEIALDSASFDNEDAAGSAAGRYWLEPGGPGEIDLSARLTRAEGTAVWRYLPRVVNRDTHEWVRTAIRQAIVPDVRFRLKGRLEDFPFRDGNGQFLVAIKVANGRLEYAPGWPAIEGIDGEVRFEGPGMRVEAARARIFDVNLSKVVADVPDLDDARTGEMMTITGRANGATSGFLRFVNESPVAQRINRFTDDMRAEGEGMLELTLVMPLRNIDDTTVSGRYRFTGNRLWLVDGLPPMEEAAGTLRFTADELSVPEARARLFGEPLQLSAETAQDGKVGFKVIGAINAVAARAELGWPVLDHLSGRSPWDAAISIGTEGTRVEVRSELEGLASSLPEPLNKGAAERWPLVVDIAYPPGGGGATVVGSLAERISAALEVGADGAIVRGGIGVFQAARQADLGVLVAATFAELDLDAWMSALGINDGGLDRAGDDELAPAPPVLPLAGIALEVERLQVFGQVLTALNLRAVADEGGWKARLDSTQAAGEFDWRAAGDGTLQARFRRLTLGESDTPRTEAPAQAATVDLSPRRLPGLDIRVDEFSIGSLALGRLDVLARNRSGQWWLERLALHHPDGRLTGNGVWQAGASPRTELDFVLETADIGRFTHALGYPDAVRGGRARLGGKLEWQGAPTRIDYPTLSGNLDVDAEQGQFRQLEPGVGRLLGILSLQALPRRITLDFRDVFSEGFAFDRISGSIAVSGGVMRTDPLEIRGPAARVLMRGSADIAAETQNLRVTVQPTLTESIAIGAAAGLINPVAGVVTYLAQKALSDPIEKLFAFDYAITGSWSDPVVEKLASPVGGLLPSLPGNPAPPDGKR